MDRKRSDNMTIYRQPARLKGQAGCGFNSEGITVNPTYGL